MTKERRRFLRLRGSKVLEGVHRFRGRINNRASSEGSKETSIYDKRESWNGLKAYQEKKRQEASSSRDTSKKGYVLTIGYAFVTR